MSRAYTATTSPSPGDAETIFRRMFPTEFLQRQIEAAHAAVAQSEIAQINYQGDGPVVFIGLFLQDTAQRSASRSSPLRFSSWSRYLSRFAFSSALHQAASAARFSGMPGNGISLRLKNCVPLYENALLPTKKCKNCQMRRS